MVLCEQSMLNRGQQVPSLLSVFNINSLPVHLYKQSLKIGCNHQLGSIEQQLIDNPAATE